MKVNKVFKLGNRVILTLDSPVPQTFKNHMDIMIDGVIYRDAIIPMESGENKRTDVSVVFENKNNLVGKEIKFI